MRRRVALILLLLSLPLSVSHAKGFYTVVPSPIIGYDPTLGAILGGALFIYGDRQQLDPPPHSFDIQLMAIEKPGLALTSHYVYRNLLPRIDFDLSMEHSNFFQNYYGEGDSTPLEALFEIDQQRWAVEPELSFGFAERWRSLFYLSLVGRTEQGLDGDASRRFADDEQSNGFGFGIYFDSRDDTALPSSGSYLQLKLTEWPASLSSLSGAEELQQLDLDYRHFTALTRRVIWGARFTLGLSSGESSYLHRYSLGGGDLLRGYPSNRFRGRHYAALQNEIRFPIWSFISGVAYQELAGVGDPDCNELLYVHGLGLRFGLPPDDRVKLRFDLGQDRDGDRRIFFTFGHAF